MTSSTTGDSFYSYKNTNGTDPFTNGDFTSIAISGNATVGGNTLLGGTLNVTGASTFTSTLTANGAPTSIAAANNVTVGGDLTVTGNITGTVTASRLLVDDATSGNVSTNATIATYNNANADNYIQVQTSSTGTGSGEGALIGVNGREVRILQREGGQPIVLESETQNSTVSLRGTQLKIRTDGTTDGTFNNSNTWSIGTYRNDQTSNYIQIQNSTTGTGSGVGILIGANGLEATLRAQDASGTVVLQTNGGTLTIASNGNITISQDLTVTGALSYGSLSANLVGSIQSQTWTFNGALVANTDFVNAEGEEFYGSFDTIDLVGWTFSAFGANTTNLVLAVTDYTTTIISGTGMSVGSITGTAGEPRVRAGTFSGVTLNASSTAFSGRGIRVSSGSGQSQVYTLQLFYRIVTV